MSRATRDSAASRVLIARVEAAATGRLSVATDDVEVSLHLLQGDLVAATTEDDDLILIRMLARAGRIDDDQAIRLEHLLDSGTDVFVELLRYDPPIEDLLRERFRQNLSDFLGCVAVPRFFEQRTVLVPNIQMGHDTAKLIDEVCTQSDLARNVSADLLLVRGRSDPGPDRFRQRIAAAAGSEPRAVSQLLEDLPLEPVRGRVVVGHLLATGVLALPGTTLPPDPREVEVEVEPSEEVPYDEDDTLSNEGLAETSVVPRVIGPRATPGAAAIVSRPQASASVSAGSRESRESVGGPPSTPSRSPPSPRIGRPDAHTPTRPAARAEPPRPVVSDRYTNPLFGVAPPRVPEPTSEETVPLDGLLAERIAQAHAAAKGERGRSLDPSPASSDRTAERAQPTTERVPVGGPDRTSAAAASERSRPLDPTVPLDRPPRPPPVDRTSRPPPVSRPEARSANLDLTTPIARPPPKKPAVVGDPGTFEPRSGSDGRSPEPLARATPVPIPRRKVNLDDEDVEDAFTEQVDRRKYDKGPRPLSDWKNRTEGLGEEELDFFSDHDHDRSAANDGRFRTADNNLEKIEVASMGGENTSEPIEAEEAQVGKYGAPMLTHGDAIAKAEVANEVLAVITSSFDSVEGAGRGRALMQLLVDGAPNQYSALLHDLRITETGEIPTDSLLRNLHHRPISEHRQLLNSTLVDLIERALSAAADELPEETIDEVLENVAGYRQRLGL